ncbi:MAG: PAS domain-containing protein [bacterium]|nr:PAS domain-containing protein [bacterium]
MIKPILNRLSFRTKTIVALIIILGGVFASHYLLLERLSLALGVSHKMTIDLFDLYNKVVLRYTAIGFAIAALAVILLYWDVLRFLRIIDGRLQYAIVKKRINTSFPTFHTGDVIESISANANALMTMFKSFDKMKSARISQEVTSIKLLMNTISEAVLLVNSDGVVTHVNHHAEDVLKLIPGEIIGESISRHVSQSDLLVALERSNHHEQRTIDMNIFLKEGDPLSLSVLPVKDKFGELVRSVVILKRLQK